MTGIPQAQSSLNVSEKDSGTIDGKSPTAQRAPTSRSASLERE